MIYWDTSALLKAYNADEAHHARTERLRVIDLA
jgi:predicted nucleic acid-binding protein